MSEWQSPTCWWAHDAGWKRDELANVSRHSEWAQSCDLGPRRGAWVARRDSTWETLLSCQFSNSLGRAFARCHCTTLWLPATVASTDWWVSSSVWWSLDTKCDWRSPDDVSWSSRARPCTWAARSRSPSRNSPVSCPYWDVCILEKQKKTKNKKRENYLMAKKIQSRYLVRNLGINNFTERNEALRLPF